MDAAYLAYASQQARIDALEAKISKLSWHDVIENSLKSNDTFPDGTG